MKQNLSSERPQISLLASRRNALQGALLILLAAICWGLSGGIGGILIARGWDPFVITFYRGALTLVFSIAWLLSAPNKAPGLNDPRLWGWSAFAGAGVAGAFSFYFLGMEFGSVAVAATLLYTAPIFVFLIGFFTGSERITTGKILGLVIVVVGVALLSGFFASATDTLTSSSAAIGVLSGLSYATFIFGFRHASSYGSVQSVMSIAFAAETLILLLIVGNSAWQRAPNAIDLGLIIFLGLVGGGFSFVFYIVGLRSSSPGIASVTAMAEPITAACFGILVLHQAVTFQQFIGAFLIVATVTAFNVLHKPPGNLSDKEVMSSNR